MAILTSEQLAAMVIRRMIFHAVEPGDGGFRAFNEIAPPPHHEFFLGRLRTTVAGNTFRFIDGSLVRTALSRIAADGAKFAEASIELGRSFQNQHTHAMKRGALMLFELAVDGLQLWALIKYDHETVLRYVTKDGGGAVDLQEIADTFVKAPEALQKTALIRLDTGEVAVRDRSNLADITAYFRGFLGVERVHTPKQLTEKLSNATRAAAVASADHLSDEVKRNISAKIHAAVQAQNQFDPAGAEPFLTAVFGPLPPDSPVRDAFAAQLVVNALQSETFIFDKTAIKRPTRRRIVTQEGVEVRVPETAASKVTVAKGVDGVSSIITIETTGLTADELEPEAADRRHRLR